jgi:phosphoglycerate dehydrogenase-like enzyme
LTKETRGMIGLRELKFMKPTAFIVNTSRGPAIKEADLIHALNEKIIAGAALDVFNVEPTSLDNPLRAVDPMRLIMTPHIIGTNPGSQDAGQRNGGAEHSLILDGKVPDTVVNPLAIPRWKDRFWP